MSGREDIARKLAPCPKNGVVEWPPSLQQCSACALFSYAGVDIRKVSKALGHSSLTITERYYAKWNKAQQDILDGDLHRSLEPSNLDQTGVSPVDNMVVGG